MGKCSLVIFGGVGGAVIINSLENKAERKMEIINIDLLERERGANRERNIAIYCQ